MFLLSQIWLYLLLAFLLGLLVMYLLDLCACRSTRDELASLRSENDDLLARVASGAGGAAIGMSVAGGDRKVSQLESQLADARAKADRLAAENARLGGKGGDDEAAKSLEWRNKYLETRVKFLEDQNGTAKAGGKSSKKATKAKAAPAKAVKAVKAVAIKAPTKKAAAKPLAITNETLVASPLAAVAPEALETQVLAAGNGKKPAKSRKKTNPDDLIKILGVGPKNLEWLHEQGIYYFHQIATMGVPELAWLANNLPTFGSRVYRENWVSQATRLAKGLSPK